MDNQKRCWNFWISIHHKYLVAHIICIYWWWSKHLWIHIVYVFIHSYSYSIELIGDRMNRWIVEKWTFKPINKIEWIYGMMKNEGHEAYCLCVYMIDLWFWISVNEHINNLYMLLFISIENEKWNKCVKLNVERYGWIQSISKHPGYKACCICM